MTETLILVLTLDPKIGMRIAQVRGTVLTRSAVVGLLDHPRDATAEPELCHDGQPRWRGCVDDREVLRLVRSALASVRGDLGVTVPKREKLTRLAIKLTD